MRVHVVYCHPSEDSFTRHVRDAFCEGVITSGNECTVSDLYAQGFVPDMTEGEYLRDANYRDEPEPADDVRAEQEKLHAADGVAFIYPVFWTEAPAKLVGWFDRVWSYGFAYGPGRREPFRRALVLCTAGNPVQKLEQFGLLQAMERVMLGDRLFRRAERADFAVFGGMTRLYGTREADWDANLRAARERGLRFFDAAPETPSLDGRFFTVAENSPGGEVSGRTVFSYHQKDGIVWAEYSGGGVLRGSLVGTADADGTLRFSYQHLNGRRELRGGTCTSRPETLPGEKLRLHETWRWSTGEAGTSVLEEV